MVRSLHFHCQERGMQSLVRELRSHKWHSAGKKKKKRRKNNRLKPKQKKITKREFSDGTVYKNSPAMQGT